MISCKSENMITTKKSHFQAPDRTILSEGFLGCEDHSGLQANVFAHLVTGFRFWKTVK